MSYFRNNFYYYPKEVENYFDEVSNILDKSQFEKDNKNDNIITFSLNPLYAYRFILSKMS